MGEEGVGREGCGRQGETLSGKRGRRTYRMGVGRSFCKSMVILVLGSLSLLVVLESERTDEQLS